jgi:hypothetical protein
MEAYRVGILNDDVVPPGENGWPFHRPNMNDGYAQLFARARRRDLPIILANDQDYAEGFVRRGWVHDGSRWVGLANVPLAGVYDQFVSGSPRGRWLTGDLAARGLKCFNDPKLTLVVDDKLLSFWNFPEIVPFTAYFHAGKDDPRVTVERFLEGCREHGYGEIDSFVAKMQTGWGARNLYRFTQENLGDLYHIPQGEYVLQPFLESRRGVPELGVGGRHDIRILLENGRFVTCLVRQPARHDWAANYFNSDELIFVHREEDVPADLMGAARFADRKFEEFYPRLVSYDMARLDNGRVVCWEMNSRPGMCADSDRPEDQHSSGQLQEAILNCLEIMVGWR